MPAVDCDVIGLGHPREVPCLFGRFPFPVSRSPTEGGKRNGNPGGSGDGFGHVGASATAGCTETEFRYPCGLPALELCRLKEVHVADEPEETQASAADPWAENVALWRQLRSKERSFTGIADHFRIKQRGLLLHYEASAAIDHNGDKGTAREYFIKEFLGGKYVPPRYGVSEGSSHVISSDGGQSMQIDIVLYDAANVARLLDVGGTQFFPLESVFGVLQVKSNLSSTAIVVDALENLASFKRLRLPGMWPGVGFSVLFAYGATLKDTTLVEAVESWQAVNPRSTWPNLIVVLDQGLVLQTDGKKSVFKNAAIQSLSSPSVVFGHDRDALLRFYLLLIDLLTTTELPPLQLASYVDLPEKVDGHSVQFHLAPKLQIHDCLKHGPALRQLREGAASEIVQNSATQAVSVSEVMGAAYPAHADSYRLTDDREVLVYNPEGHELQEVLFLDHDLITPDRKRLPFRRRAFDTINIDSSEYWVPGYYSQKRSLIVGCRKCKPKFDANLTLSEWKLAFRELLEAPPPGET